MSNAAPADRPQVHRRLRSLPVLPQLRSSIVLRFAILKKREAINRRYAADLIVRHEQIEWIPNPETRYGPREIPKNFKIRCAMVKLHEKGTKPLVVTYDNGKRSESWDVEVNLAKNHPGGGMITITWVSPDGNSGLANIEIAVKVEFTFTQQGTGKVLKVTSPTEWLSETGHEWTRYADAAAMKMFYIPKESQGNFIPASRYLGGSFQPLGKCSQNNQVKHSFTLAPTMETLKGAPAGMMPLIDRIPLRKSRDLPSQHQTP